MNDFTNLLSLSLYLSLSVSCYIIFVSSSVFVPTLLMTITLSDSPIIIINQRHVLGRSIYIRFSRDHRLYFLLCLSASLIVCLCLSVCPSMSSYCPAKCKTPPVVKKFVCLCSFCPSCPFVALCLFSCCCFGSFSFTYSHKLCVNYLIYLAT